MRSALVVTGAPLAQASGGDDGLIEVEYDGVRVLATTATTGGRSDSFSVERRVANRAGSDSFHARAPDVSSGQLCVGRLTF